MQVTARQITDRVFRLLRLYGPGETPSADDSSVALVALNAMLDAWGLEDFFILSSAQEVFPLTNGVSSYTVGPSGSFNTVRPIKVLDSSFVRIGSVDYPISSVTNEQYNSIPYKTSSGIPKFFYYDAQVPLGVLNLYWTPYSGMTLYLNSNKPLLSFADLDTVYQVGDGYLKALTYSLAEEVAPEFDVEIGKGVVAHARSSRKIVKRRNHEVPVLAVDIGTREFSTRDWAL